MRFSGHTPLSKMPAEKISAQQHVLLSALWVESVEELTAMMAAMESVETTVESAIINPLKQCESALLESVPHEALAPWREAKAGGGLGCQINPEVLEMFQTKGRLSSPGATLPQLSDAPLPPSVRLMEHMFSVRDQGKRGTCVAFASVGLREYLEGCNSELSEQFLYWACKQSDGYPDEAGTFIHIAMSALGTMGVCEWPLWPYNPEPDPGNESQDPPPNGATEQALTFVMPATRAIAPNWVNLYKQVLAGVDGFGQMPIVIASLVFNSWYRSAATHQTGKITLPLPGEMPLSGGHAMLIVGYQDDPSVPGGGYFIVRNSWSEDWAAQSPEARGHALMPYAYIEQYIVEAFSGQAVSHARKETPDGNTTSETERPDPSQLSFEGKYVRTLRGDQRDMEGKLLRAGSRVICHRDASAEIMEDTGPNRRHFSEKGCGWSDRVRRIAWFPSRDRWDEALEAAASQARIGCQTFAGAIDENVMSAAGRPIPDINVSRLSNALAWRPKVRNVTNVADLSDGLITALNRLGGLPEAMTPTPEWQEVLQHSNCLKVYQLQSRAGSFHVVSAFLTPWRFSPAGETNVSEAGPECTDLVQSLYQAWQSQQPKIRFTFYTLGCARQWTSGAESISSGRWLTVLSGKNEDNRWSTQAPPKIATSVHLRDFMDRLHPETRQVKISRVKSVVDRYIDEAYEGNILLDKVVPQTGYRRSVIEEAFKALQHSGDYETYYVDKRLAIRPIGERKTKE